AVCEKSCNIAGSQCTVNCPSGYRCESLFSFLLLISDIFSLLCPNQLSCHTIILTCNSASPTSTCRLLCGAQLACNTAQFICNNQNGGQCFLSCTAQLACK